MGFVYGSIFGLFVGIVISVVFTSRVKARCEKPSGTFIIDFSDPVKDVCRLELDENLNELYSKRQMTLLIKTYGDDSLK